MKNMLLGEALRGNAASRAVLRWLRSLSIFEKIIIANSVIIVLDTLAGWWIAQRNPETYHYLIDTAFISLAAILGVVVNFAILRNAFAPLHSVLTTIRAVERGDLLARAESGERDADAFMLACAFNRMLDRLADLRDETTTQVLRAQEDERRRLALELHDQTGQSLTAVTLHAQAIAQGLASEGSEAARRARAQAERLSALAQQTLGEVQAIARSLRPSVLDDLGIASAFRWLAADASERLGVTIEVTLRGAEIERRGRLADETQSALFRIAQESVTNAVRHGKASVIRLLLRSTPDSVRLLIADDGVGFIFAARSDATAGVGLSGMRERARLLQGAVRVRSWPGHGSAVIVLLPARWEDTEVEGQPYVEEKAPHAR